MTITASSPDRHRIIKHDDASLRNPIVRVIAGKTLDEWREFARRDDCLDQMVPSDLRLLVQAIGQPQ